MRILVTGGAGFIGSHYVRSLLAGQYLAYRGAQVTVVDKLTYAGTTTSLPMADPRLQFVHADICDAEPLLELLPGHDAVVHFAAESHVDRSIGGAAEFVRTNVQGTHNLLECSRLTGVPRVVVVSTDEVYGSIATGSWTEESRLEPNSPYSASKAAADLIARSYWRTHAMDISITRCSNNYGPYQFPEKVIPLFISNLMDGKPVPLYGDGSNVREWLHVDDHCRAIQAVLEGGRAGEVYNVGGGRSLTNKELTELLITLCGADWSAVRHVEDRKGHDQRYAVDDSKIREQLGFRNQVAFEQGLADVVRWYQDNRSWWEPLRRREEAALPRT
ncbi:dTDP-glucose 4,6-dehydratase [Kitasatospora phosalacinea]|uniref:dTDP-glucose 4,6-dehydratase n=1 Tax=Kitasatospora phosalacinea TaxID=2065 RepID=A0A9W6V6P6_9ACTN|nr:dTDP-glucose 4,6-dehydratase [Kitasatospora phosalacinea]GLW74462.1 dTDP-glucose 4,6-dehydratase [Kitasatospora phosalacinea]